MFALEPTGSSADFIVCAQTQHSSAMTPRQVEQLLTQDARLLARRDSPVIDQELEQQRQAALEIYWLWQDHKAKFQDVEFFCTLVQKKVNLNRQLLKWEKDHIEEY